MASSVTQTGGGVYGGEDIRLPHSAVTVETHEGGLGGKMAPMGQSVPTYSTVTTGAPRLDALALANTQPQTRIFLKPLAKPSCLGMAAYFGGTWVFGTFLCGWYDETNVQSFIVPFLFFYGGLAQFISGFYGFPARDHLATVFHVSWGSFYMSYAFIYFFGLIGSIPSQPSEYTNQPATATWMVVMAAITYVVCIASIGRDLLVFIITFLQAVGATVLFGGWYSNGSENTRTTKTAGYFMMLSALVALLYVFSVVIVETFTDGQFPLWDRVLAWNNRMPWQRAGQTAAIRIPVNEPGIKKGQ